MPNRPLSKWTTDNIPDQPGKLVIVTGGNSGIGFETARILAKKGATVVLAVRNREKGQAAAATILQELPEARVEVRTLDLADLASIKAFTDQFIASHQQLDLLINNAGISMFYPVSESTEELLDRILKVNTYGSILTVSVFLNDLIQNRGRIVQISSDSVRLPTLFHPYPNSKIALEAFSTSMRQELSLFGIDLILIRPGAINTSLLEEVKSVSNPVENSKYEKYFQTFMQMAKQDVGKMAEPTLVARLVKKALLAKKPRKIYSINRNKKISLLANLPQRWIDYFVKKAAMK